ncbi:MAG TPA: SDR family NAD(P)-dependent oxidoreductase [Streptosporangiaceae bacterium]|nr:SDR family NAD(P)-dependent oxidoreductase [Streptosporangiaceae bacterium]
MTPRPGQRLAGKTALITGASRGQGAAEARRFAASGAHVVLTDVLDDMGESVAAAIRADGGEARYRHLDVTDRNGWAVIVEEISATSGALHILVNNAGINRPAGPVMTTTPDDLDRILAVNLKGPLFGIQAAAPLIRDSGGGAIVNIGSIAGVTGHFAAKYSMSKWALRGLTKSAALELAGWNIRVVAVHPGIVDTPIVDGADDFVEAMRRSTPLQRVADPDELAAVVEFYASDDARFITGVDISVDGGLTDLGNYFAVAQSVKNAAEYVKYDTQPGQ